MWALAEIVVLMPIIWKVWVKNMMAIFRTALNRESSALLKCLILWVQYRHRNRGACSGSEMSPVLHGLMPSRDQTMPEGSK